ncbi:hypothetical protein C0993_008010 [Termitomyces sp. T159_Od127]|nr:hypothetical protein C0993_008010 [Termitomyces sp. T159_Od127]
MSSESLCFGADVLEEEFGKLQGVVSGAAGEEDGLLGQQLTGEWLEKTVEVVMENLGLDTQLTGPDIPGDVLLHAWPKVSLGDELKGLTNPGMSMELVVVVLAEDVEADCLVVWGIDLSVSEKKLVVGGECEGVVSISIVWVVPGVMLSEGVLGGITNFV